jgi:hypothetical protein
MVQTDFECHRYGTVFLLAATTDEALEHLEDVVDDEAQWLNNYTLAVDHHYIENLVERLRVDGYTVDTGQEDTT